jgi:uncharacterized protein YbjT (DUF2867 family)
MATFVVAGVTGRVGAVVAAELAAQGQHVRGISRGADRGDVTQGSLDDPDFLTRMLAGADGFFALLPEDPFAADFHGGRRAMADAMATAVRASRVPHVVLLSAVAASLADGNGPAKDLYYAEHVLRDAATKLSIVRACWFQENIGAVIGAANEAAIYPNFMGSADARFPTIATRDVGRVAASLLLSPPAASEVIDLAGPLYSSRELATALGSALGKQLQVVDVPAVARAGALMQAGLPQPFAETVAELYACFESGRVRPEGDRALAGATTIHEVLPDLLVTLGGRAAPR